MVRRHLTIVNCQYARDRPDTCGRKGLLASETGRRRSSAAATFLALTFGNLKAQLDYGLLPEVQLQETPASACLSRLKSMEHGPEGNSRQGPFIPCTFSCLPLESLPRPIACGLEDGCHLSVPGPPSSNVTAGHPDQPRGPQSELGARRNRSAKSGLRGMIAIDGASGSGRPCDTTMSSAKSSHSFSPLSATCRHGHRSLTCQARRHSPASQCHKARN